MDILIVLEDNNGAIHRMGLETITAAQCIAAELNLTTAALVLGKNADKLAEQAAKYDLDQVVKIDHPNLQDYSSDGFAIAVEQAIKNQNCTYVIFGHTYQVRDYVPKVSARMMKPFLADNIAIEFNGNSIIFTKQTFNAKLFTDITVTSDGPHLVSFQSAAYMSDDAKPGSAPIDSVSIDLDPSLIKTSSEEPFKETSGGVDLSAAEIIVSVGRGIGEKDNISIAKNLANALGAELSSSRPVVDADWLSADHQVGSSGQSVSPKMYLALGISGAIQHVVGMKGSKNIVAINKDPDAPIFEIADYGVVGDIMEIVPKLTEALQ